MIEPNYKERQDQRRAECALRQIAYSEAYFKEIEMARGRKPAVAKQAEQLSAALKFISVAGKKEQEHFWWNNSQVTMFDGQITAGHEVEEQLECFPHLGKLMIALNKCGKTLSIALLDSNRLSIKGDNLRVLIPCLEDTGALAGYDPDPNIAPATDALKAAFKTCGVLADEHASTVIEASLLLEANFCTSTDRHVMMQYFHGVDLPPALIIPKVFADAVAKVETSIVGFGYTPDRSITIWFENGSWLKTLLYADKWPDVSRILDQKSFPTTVPDGFFKGIEIVNKFSEDTTVYLLENSVQSHLQSEVGAQYDVPGLQEISCGFNGEWMNWIAPFVTKIDLTTYPDKAMFFGENMRGCIMGVAKSA